MALHRDIYWLGRQWAVTGLGLQLIDQKLQGFFDIEASRLWEEPLIAKMHGKEWLNRADFDKGLALARTRYSQTPRAVAPGGGAGFAAHRQHPGHAASASAKTRRAETQKA